MSNNRLSSLRVRLVVIVALAVSPAVLMVAHTSWQARRLAELRAETDARRLAEFAASQERKAIEGARKHLNTVATRLIKGNPPQITPAFLRQQMGSNSPYLNLAVTDPAGNIVASSVPADDEANVATQPWFERLKNMGKFVADNTSIDPVIGKRALICAVPIDPPGGDRKGVIYAALRMAWVRDAAGKSEFTDGTKLEVFNASGVRLGGTSSNVRSGEEPLLPRYLNAQLPQRGDTRVLMENGEPHEDTWLRVIHHLPGIMPGADNYIVVSIPAAKLDAAAQDRRVRDILLLLSIASLALGLAWFGSERLVLSRTRALVDAARRLGEGDFSARTGMTPRQDRPDEIGDLVRKFDEMAEKLQIERHQRQQLEEQVRISQKMEAMGLLAGGVAHDFNNLLQIISGSVQVAQHSLQPGDSAEPHLANARQATERGAQLTRQLLAMTRQQTVERAPVELNGLVTSLLQMIRRVIGEDIQVSFNPEPEPAWANADPGQIEQLLLNLCLNARDAMPNGGQLELGARSVEVADDDPRRPGVRPGWYHELSVKDTGIGIPEEHLARIFDPFFTTKPKDRGTGLGLSVVYGIVRQHEGHIRVESELKVGSTFFVLIRGIAAPTDASGGDDSSGIDSRGTETLLVVEDEELVRELSVHLLVEAGYTVLSSSNGAEACEVFAKQADKIALVILDVIMPRMGGAEAARRMRAIRPGVPIIFCSGYSGSALEEDPTVSISQQLISKPYRAEELLRRVRETIDSAPAKGQQPTSAT